MQQVAELFTATPTEDAVAMPPSAATVQTADSVKWPTLSGLCEPKAHLHPIRAQLVEKGTRTEDLLITRKTYTATSALYLWARRQMPQSGATPTASPGTSSPPLNGGADPVLVTPAAWGQLGKPSARRVNRRDIVRWV